MQTDEAAAEELALELLLELGQCAVDEEPPVAVRGLLATWNGASDGDLLLTEVQAA